MASSEATKPSGATAPCPAHGIASPAARHGGSDAVSGKLYSQATLRSGCPPLTRCG